MQVIYAANEFYYPGDGMNLRYTPNFTLKPHDFERRVENILRVSESDDTYVMQYSNMIELIGDTLIIVNKSEAKL